jgi:RNA polymerase sigma factor (TIGR02999 family)
LINDVSHLLSAIERGDPHAAGQLLPLVYGELRRLAAQRLAREAPGLTLQPTELVHEAYLRLVGTGAASRWDGRGHFFAAAAEAMRRISRAPSSAPGMPPRPARRRLTRPGRSRPWRG